MTAPAMTSSLTIADDQWRHPVTFTWADVIGAVEGSVGPAEIGEAGGAFSLTAECPDGTLLQLGAADTPWLPSAGPQATVTTTYFVVCRYASRAAYLDGRPEFSWIAVEPDLNTLRRWLTPA